MYYHIELLDTVAFVHVFQHFNCRQTLQAMYFYAKFKSPDVYFFPQHRTCSNAGVSSLRTRGSVSALDGCHAYEAGFTVD